MESTVERPLLSLRSTLVFLLAVLAGAVAGGLTALAGEGTARSVLAGFAAAGLAVPFFNSLISCEDRSAQPSCPAPVGTAREESNG
ncbi:hypothetical protein [Streptomyces sp. NPDC012825]|uniref:hypothetical protein n=1 Tax=Streptomyces sp. NPDC012825 TaxID=3364851 RepID=UPI00368B6379